MRFQQDFGKNHHKGVQMIRQLAGVARRLRQMGKL
jgi:hypothetical protein